MTGTLLVYGLSATLAALYVLATIGVLCLLGEALTRAVRLHRAGLERVRRAGQ